MPNFTHKRKSVSRLMAPVALAVILAGCSAPNLYNQQAPLTDITAAAAQSSAAYLSKAQASKGAERINWEILALKAMIEEGKWQQADQQVTKLSQQSMSPLQIAEWQLARASIRYHQGQYQEALNSLNFQPSWQLTKSQYQRYYTFRAELLDQLNHKFQAARERSKLDFYLSSDQKAANWNNLWNDLSGYSNTQLSNVKIGSDEGVLKGWVELAMLKNSTSRQPGKLKDAVEQWLSQHPYHPANQYLPAELEAVMNLKAIKLDRVALLLPLSGRFAAQGKTVRDGFIDAMMDDADRSADTNLNIYDTDAESMASIMAKLQQNGTQFVVGPLRKNKISEFQQDNTTHINTLALNMPPEINSNHPNACYFALSPEQGAEQAAEHIFSEGHRNPIVLVPSNSYGQRVSTAFNQEWTSLNSQPAQVATFGASDEIPQQIRQVFGRAPGSQTDAIYIVASKNELMTIKPFIEASLPPSGNPPQIYVSSRSNPDRKGYSPEIRGVEIGDIPLLVNPPASYMERFNQLWPNEGNTSVRLHAFGMDAYLLSNELPQLRAMSDYTTQGVTGKLSADGQCVIHRQIDWGKFTADGIQPE
ncbi:penicillin-binding protein activator [Photobacterium angustum]|uniref:Penicillin-binding protein activator LpoA n=2 Tax=Photobacterium angustum TaxID=661 RepID=A0A855SBU9_PHOAN|nr:penicillin-binding protein activator [Photobacterium angustum]KJF81172.1 penicillin-binding protein [Photobacterium damselae subsp. damselae]KJG29589.1 penicillin-binding protein [Photobacterium angustum]KJG39321.1 penicillin-binding protein [Photobacterium angustum]KJG44684.1 penicillin-binding protein [Photobacterium angustum]KJG48357.1 penicillin-binding protein [Photobacterium angustum]